MAPIGAFELEAAAGYVPSTYLAEPPHDGHFKAAFSGETLGELPAAEADDLVWKIDPKAGSVMGWVDVVLRSGVRGQAPETFIEWLSEPPQSADANMEAAAIAGEDGAVSGATEAAPSAAEGANEEDDGEDEWFDAAKGMIAGAIAGGFAKMEAVALADFDAETEARGRPSSKGTRPRPNPLCQGRLTPIPSSP